MRAPRLRNSAGGMDDFTALRLQIEWGADEALEAEPVNRLRTLSVAATVPLRTDAQSADPPDRVVVASAPTSRTTPAERALQAASAATNLEALRAAIAGFDGCALRDTASNLVFAEGDPSSGLMLIGDAPGADEDRSGMPFAGVAGAYLDRMLSSIGLARAGLLLSPLIPWRPPGDRPPSPTELTICLPFLFRLIALAAPRRLVLLGPLAVRAILGQATRRRPRGAWLDVAVAGLSQALPAMPTFSPGELMRNPRDRRAAWADLRLLRRTLDADITAK
jgi:uracil-DNA glycosylase